MDKKIIWAVVAVIIIVLGAIFYTHGVPVWVSISNVISLAIGIALGFIASVLYVKYFKKDKNE